MKNKVLDYYFKRPIFWDVILALILVAIVYKITIYFGLGIPTKDQLISVISDLSNISLTSAGFILTLLTLLITFKSSSSSKIEDMTNDNSRFEIFFTSRLYFITVKLLKYCIISLIFISIIGYCLKLIDFKNNLFLFLTGVFILFILIITLLRCLLILTKILELQKHNNED